MPNRASEANQPTRHGWAQHKYLAFSTMYFLRTHSRLCNLHKFSHHYYFEGLILQLRHFYYYYTIPMLRKRCCNTYSMVTKTNGSTNLGPADFSYWFCQRSPWMGCSGPSAQFEMLDRMMSPLPTGSPADGSKNSWNLVLTGSPLSTSRFL